MKKYHIMRKPPLQWTIPVVIVAMVMGLGFFVTYLGDFPLFSAYAATLEPVRKFQMKFPLGIPEDLWELFIPEDNPLTEAKVALGKALYFDKRLSVDRTVSCATCHDPKAAFTDGKPVSEGVGGKKGARNAPTILNALFNPEQFWDGRAKSLEDQVKQPLINPVEMAMPSHEAVVDVIQQIPSYREQFQLVFKSPVTRSQLILSQKLLQPLSVPSFRGIHPLIDLSMEIKRLLVKQPGGVGSCSRKKPVVISATSSRILPLSSPTSSIITSVSAGKPPQTSSTWSSKFGY